MSSSSSTNCYNCPIARPSLKVDDNTITCYSLVQGKVVCHCGGSFTNKTFVKHKTTQRCLKHQADRIISELKSSKSQDEAHDAVRGVPEEIVDKINSFAEKQLNRILKVMFVERERVGYDPTHA